MQFNFSNVFNLQFGFQSSILYVVKNTFLKVSLKTVSMQKFKDPIVWEIRPRKTQTFQSAPGLQRRFQ